jgi:hypothetical protein
MPGVPLANWVPYLLSVLCARSTLRCLIGFCQGPQVPSSGIFEAGDMSGTISGKTTRATRTARIRLFDCALMLIFAFLLGILWGTTTTPTYYQVIKLEN